MTTAIPLLPCRKLDDVLPFYESLGFELTTRQERPNPYAANSVGICLFIVDEVEELHAAFKRIGTWASNARITRMKPGQSRFTVFDPAGNSERPCEPREVLRDFKNDDAAAAKVLTQALARARREPRRSERAKVMLAELL